MRLAYAVHARWPRTRGAVNPVALTGHVDELRRARDSVDDCAAGVDDCAAGDVDLAGGDGLGPVGRGEGGGVCDLVVGGLVAGQQADGAWRGR